jgi:hypothetical protein
MKSTRRQHLLHSRAQLLGLLLSQKKSQNISSALVRGPLRCRLKRYFDGGELPDQEEMGESLLKKAGGFAVPVGE